MSTDIPVPRGVQDALGDNFNDTYYYSIRDILGFGILPSPSRSAGVSSSGGDDPSQAHGCLNGDKIGFYYKDSIMKSGNAESTQALVVALSSVIKASSQEVNVTSDVQGTALNTEDGQRQPGSRSSHESRKAQQSSSATCGIISRSTSVQRSAIKTDKTSSFPRGVEDVRQSPRGIDAGMSALVGRVIDSQPYKSVQEIISKTLRRRKPSQHATTMPHRDRSRSGNEIPANLRSFSSQRQRPGPLRWGVGLGLELDPSVHLTLSAPSRQLDLEVEDGLLAETPYWRRARKETMWRRVGVVELDEPDWKRNGGKVSGRKGKHKANRDRLDVWDRLYRGRRAVVEGFPRPPPPEASSSPSTRGANSPTAARQRQAVTPLSPATGSSRAPSPHSPSPTRPAVANKQRPKLPMPTLRPAGEKTLLLSRETSSIMANQQTASSPVQHLAGDVQSSMIASGSKHSATNRLLKVPSHEDVLVRTGRISLNLDGSAANSSATECSDGIGDKSGVLGASPSPAEPAGQPVSEQPPDKKLLVDSTAGSAGEADPHPDSRQGSMSQVPQPESRQEAMSQLPRTDSRQGPMSQLPRTDSRQGGHVDRCESLKQLDSGPPLQANTARLRPYVDEYIALRKALCGDPVERPATAAVSRSNSVAFKPENLINVVTSISSGPDAKTESVRKISGWILPDPTPIRSVNTAAPSDYGAASDSHIASPRQQRALAALRPLDSSQEISVSSTSSKGSLSLHFGLPSMGCGALLPSTTRRDPWAAAAAAAVHQPGSTEDTPQRQALKQQITSLPPVPSAARRRSITAPGAVTSGGCVGGSVLDSPTVAMLLRVCPHNRISGGMARPSTDHLEQYGNGRSEGSRVSLDTFLRVHSATSSDIAVEVESTAAAHPNNGTRRMSSLKRQGSIDVVRRSGSDGLCADERDGAAGGRRYGGLRASAWGPSSRGV